ncbi:putative methyltransferase DDB_G0268948 [Trichonephila clavipes]|nr:putative methyltransferase DDB_G0268948 [Trichonephila clavipes]
MGKEEKEKWDDKMRIENREGSLGYPVFVKPVFTKDSKPLGSLGYFGIVTPVSSPFGQALDVGCGTGQSTLTLAPYFQSVLGCDVSKSQILEANFSRKATNVQYRVSPAECLPVGNESVCLLTAGTCFHWFDIPAFFREAKRVLVQGGVLAVYSSCAIHPITGDEEKDYQLRMITNKVFLTIQLNFIEEWVSVFV